MQPQDNSTTAVQRPQESSKLNQALALAKRGFHVFPIAEGQKDPPVFEGWQKLATRDEATLRAWWAKPRWSRSNVGISTTHFGDDQALIVVDVDVKNGKTGFTTLEKLAAEECGGEIPRTRMVRTQSGGRHLYYVASKAVKQGAEVLGPGVDIRSRGGYVVAPGSTVDGRAYTLEDDHPIANLPEGLLQKLRAKPERAPAEQPAKPIKVNAAAASARAVHYLEKEAPEAVEGAGGDQTTFGVACRVLDFGVPELQAVDLMLDHWNDRCSPPWSPEDLAVKAGNAVRYRREAVGSGSTEAVFDVVEPQPEAEDSDAAVAPSKAADVAVAELNKTCALVRVGGKMLVLLEESDDDDLILMKPHDFHIKYLNHPVPIVRGGKRKHVPVSQIWLNHGRRREYKAIDFRPEGTPPNVYNLWRGFAMEPDSEASCQLFLDHMLENVCRRDEALFQWVMGWFAQLIQQPHKKLGTALVVRGLKGTGKTIVGETVGALLGRHHVLVANPRLVTGNFNAHLDSCLLLQADEAFWAGDKQAEGTLKDLITGNTMLIERKGIDPIPVRNLVRLLATTNSDWAVPASMDERRFAVVDVGDAHRQDHAYFGAIQAELDAGGLGALLHYLQTFDLDAVNLRAIPNTRALLDQKLQSLPTIEAWWLDALAAGQIDEWGVWPPEVDRRHLFDQFKNYAKRHGVRHIESDNWVARKLAGLIPGIRSVQRRVAGGRSRLYQLPTLDECREHFDRLVGGGIEWDDDRGEAPPAAAAPNVIDIFA